MGLEVATFISQLNATNPVGATDPKSQGDDHLRLIKSVLQASFPNINAAVTATPTQLNAAGGSGITGFAIAANKIKGSGAAAAGVATTALRSDSTNVVDLTDAYSWTGSHTWSGATPNAQVIGSSAANGVYATYQRSGTALADIGNSAQCFGGGVLDNFGITTRGARAIDFGYNSTFKWRMNASDQFLTPDGSNANPAYSFVSDPDTGWRWSSSGVINYISNGTLGVSFAGNATRFGDGFASGDRLVLFNNVARSSSNLEHYVAHSATLLDFYSYDGSVTNLGAVRFRQSKVVFSDGSTGSPSIAFDNDNTMGLSRPGANQMNTSIGGAAVTTHRTAALGGLSVADYGGTHQTVGFRNIPQNAQTINYTCVLADAGKHIYHASGAGAGDTYTIPANASVAYDIGTVLTFVNEDSNTVSIAITTDTMTLAGSALTGTRTLATNGIATALKTTATRWMISGPGVS